MMDIINFAIHAVFWVLGFLFLFRITRCGSGVTENSHYPSISIIVPARNEEKTLPILLASLKDQSLTPDEIIIVVNQSEDRTMDIAEEADAITIQSEPPPAGWVGKPWACYQGAIAAKGEILIFLDADTFLEKDGLKKILNEYLKKAGVLSIQPYHKTKRLYEQFSLFFNLIGMAAMGAFTIIGRHTRPIGLFGPCLVMRRGYYFDKDGHREVRSEIVDDLALGEGLKRRRIPIYCYGGKGTISFRMYPNGMRELIDGWSKNFAIGASKTPLPMLLAIIAWIGGGIGSPIYLIESISNMNTSLIFAWASLYMLYAIQIYWMIFRVGTFKFYTALFYLVPLLFFVSIFIRSFFMVFIKKSVTWKGSTFNLKDRSTD